MDNISELTDQLGKLTARIDAAVGVMQESKGEDAARWEAADNERKAAAVELGEIREKMARAERDAATDAALQEWQATKAFTHAPSKASLVGPGNAPTGYQAGDFLKAIVDSKSNDPELFGPAKAALRSMGSGYME
jgi:tRNA(Glu) U13 pseudouridine synthase TruD